MKATAASLCGLALLVGATACAPATDETPEVVVPPEIVAIPNAKFFDETVLIGGQPTSDNLQEAADAGYKTVINLRPAGELTEWDEQAAVEALGLEYISIPVAGADGLTQENAERLRSELDRAGGRPILLHCSSGNRVGALLALSAFHIDDKGPDEALAIGIDNLLTSLEPSVAEYLTGQATPD